MNEVMCVPMLVDNWRWAAFGPGSVVCIPLKKTGNRTVVGTVTKFLFSSAINVPIRKGHLEGNVKDIRERILN